MQKHVRIGRTNKPSTLPIERVKPILKPFIYIGHQVLWPPKIHRIAVVNTICSTKPTCEPCEDATKNHEKHIVQDY